MQRATTAVRRWLSSARNKEKNSAIEKDDQSSQKERSLEENEQRLEVIHHDNGNTYHVLSKQPGAKVYRVGNDHIIKFGKRVSRSELLSMKLVQEYTDVPIGFPFDSNFNQETGVGSIFMEIVPGMTLDKLWARLNEPDKANMCQAAWNMILKLRQIPRPVEREGGFTCLIDGSPSNDPLIKEDDTTTPPVTICTGDDVRMKICERYRQRGGRRYEKNELFEMLPTSTESVFTHADIAPRNIMVHQTGSGLYKITGIIDWEMAGWYPHYWEYSNIFRPAVEHEYDWQRWMDKFAPETLKCSLEGIKAARRVLF